MGRVNRKDVAELAGVAPSTVSNILNGRASALGILPSTADRVRAAAYELGYIPHAGARMLRAGTSQTLGLMLGGLPLRLRAPVLVDIVTTAIAQARQRSHVVLPFVNPGDTETDVNYIDRILADVDLAGVIGELSPRNLAAGARLHALDIPVVWMSLESPPMRPPGLAHVTIRQAPGVEEVIRQLWMEPGEEAAILVGPGARPERIDVALRAFDRETHVISTPTWLAHAGAEGFAVVRENYPRVRTVFCGDDLLAAGFLDAMREAGFAAPDDYSVMGFGGHESDSPTEQRITSVRWPLRELTEVAVELLVGHLMGDARLELSASAPVVRTVDCSALLGTTARLRR